MFEGLTSLVGTRNSVFEAISKKAFTNFQTSSRTAMFILVIVKKVFLKSDWLIVELYQPIRVKNAIIYRFPKQNTVSFMLLRGYLERVCENASLCLWMMVRPWVLEGAIGYFVIEWEWFCLWVRVVVGRGMTVGRCMIVRGCGWGYDCGCFLVRLWLRVPYSACCWVCGVRCGCAHVGSGIGDEL